ncbi:hypothetical protein OG548_25580 [Streptomyces sp. NBC_01356]|uniref:hypothetical protein n=1 Tax=Streptomyces sp. NBC_01356 TaxID=2903836 RepID=UPI002E33EE1C|nr:hypothetical protein [Streptomyces sp. NBC_01356]
MADDAKTTAQQAILEGIAKAAEELEKHSGPAQASGLKELAEAYAWVTFPSQPH